MATYLATRYRGQRPEKKDEIVRYKSITRIRSRDFRPKCRSALVPSERLIRTDVSGLRTAISCLGAFIKHREIKHAIVQP